MGNGQRIVSIGIRIQNFAEEEATVRLFDVSELLQPSLRRGSLQLSSCVTTMTYSELCFGLWEAKPIFDLVRVQAKSPNDFKAGKITAIIETKSWFGMKSTTQTIVFEPKDDQVQRNVVDWPGKFMLGPLTTFILTIPESTMLEVWFFPEKI